MSVLNNVQQTDSDAKLKFYYAAKIKLEQAKNWQDLLPFCKSLLSVDDLKIILDERLDKMINDNNKDNNKSNNNKDIRSVYLNIGSINELLPNDILVKIVTFLNIDNEYGKIPLISKQFHSLMTGYPNIYHNYFIEIVDDPISKLALKKNKTNVQFDIDHKENEIWIGNKYTQNQIYEDDINNTENEDIFKCSFPWNHIKKWRIKCKRNSWLPSNKQFLPNGNDKIINCLNKSSKYIQSIEIIDPPLSDRIIDKYPIFNKCFSVSINGEIIDDSISNIFGCFNKFPILRYLEIGPITLNLFKTKSRNNRREKYILIKNIIDKCPKLNALSITQQDRPKADIFNLNNEYENESDDDQSDERYIEWILPSTIEFLQIHRIRCTINISYCNNIIGFEIENIKRYQIKFSDHNHEANIDCFLCYDDTQFGINRNLDDHSDDDDDETDDDETGFQQLLPIQFIGYKNDRRNTKFINDKKKQYFDINVEEDDLGLIDQIQHISLEKEQKMNHNQLSPRQIISNYLNKISINHHYDYDDDHDDIKSDDSYDNDNDFIIQNIKCITLGPVDDDLFDILIKYHFRDNKTLMDLKLEQYSNMRNLNIAQWVWSFGKMLPSFSYSNLW